MRNERSQKSANSKTRPDADSGGGVLGSVRRDEIAAEVATLEREARAIASMLRLLNAEKRDLVAAELGLVPNETVVIVTGKRAVFVAVEREWDHRQPYLKVRFIRKDGTPGVDVRTAYDWKKALDA